jgi:ubiquinone/menaquinone biosynthesis C-methylase UbiE
VAAAIRKASGYDRVALDYESRIVPYYTPVAEQLVKLAEPLPGMFMLDVGAGTGLVARKLEPRLRPGGLLVLVDQSARMLAVARQHMPQDRGSTPFVLLTTDAQTMHLAGRQFDLAVAQFSAIEELPRAILEVFRVLKPGAGLAMAVWGPDRLHDEYKLLKSVRHEIGAPAMPKHATVATIVTRLRRAGFVSIRSRQKYFPGVYADAHAYVHYRDGFPWRDFLARTLWADYLPAVARQAELRIDRRGRVVIGRSVTFLNARKQIRAS